MLSTMEVFSGHTPELTVWVTAALEAHSVAGDTDDDITPDKSLSKTPSKSPAGKKKGSKPGAVQESFTKEEKKPLGVVAFLGRCLSALVNNPTPYADRVMEALNEAGEDTLDGASIATSDTAREAILLMDDEELDRLVEASSFSSITSTSASATSPTTQQGLSITPATSPGLSLPISPLVLVALDQLKHSDSVPPSSVKYLSRVLIDLLHTLDRTSTLSRLVLYNSELATSTLDADLVQFISTWGAGRKQIDLSPKQPADLCPSFTATLMKLRSAAKLDFTEKKLAKLNERLEAEQEVMSSQQRMTGLGQVLLYMGETESMEASDVSITFHTYRRTAETLVAAILDEVHKNTKTNDSCTQDTQDDSGIEESVDQIQEILSSLKTKESVAETAVRKILSNPELLRMVSPEGNSNQGAKKSSKSPRKGRKSLSKTSRVSEAVSNEVMSLFESVWRKIDGLPWLAKDAKLVEKHMEMAVECIVSDHQNKGEGGEDGRQSKAKKRKMSEGGDKKEMEDCGKVAPLAGTCMEVVRTLHPHLGTHSLSRSVVRLLQLFSSKFGVKLHSDTSDVMETDQNSDEDDDDVDIRDTKGKSKSTDQGKASVEALILEVVQHWTDRLTSQLSSGHLNVLLGNKHISAQTKENSNTTTNRLRVQVSPSFEDASGLTPDELRPLFTLMYSSKNSLLNQCVYRLVDSAPSLASVCVDCIPKQVSTKPASLEAVVGRRLAQLLIKQDSHLISSLGDWLCEKQGRPLSLTADNCWLATAYIGWNNVNSETKPKCLKSVVKSMGHDLPGLVKSQDGLDLLKVTCTAVGSDDPSFQEKVLQSVVARIRESRTDLVHAHYDLLRAVSKFCPSLPHDGEKNQRPKTEALTLDLLLRHMSEVAASKTRDETWVDYLLSQSLEMVSNVSKEPTGGDYDGPRAYWSSFVKNTLRNLYKNPKLLDLLSRLVPHIYHRSSSSSSSSSSSNSSRVELTAATMFTMVSSHTAFCPVMLTTDFNEAKDGVVHLLYTLGEIEPTSFTSKLRPVLVGAYRATLSITDQTLLQMIELTGDSNDLGTDCPVLWGSGALHQHSVSQALGPTLLRETPVANTLALLDVNTLHRSTINFPLRRTLVGKTILKAGEYKSQEDCYDPRFLLRLFVNIVGPDKQVPLHQFVEKGCLGYLLVALSCHDTACRLLAYMALNDLHLHMQGSKWAARTEVSFLLDLINASRHKDGQKLSFAMSLFLSRVAKLLLYPADPLYMPLVRFLVARPEMDLSSAPEFYKLFFSTGTNYRVERAWVLTLLSEGLRETSDYWLYQKKSVFKIVLAFYGSALSDKQSQSLVLSLVKAACKEKNVAVHLVKNHGLLEWLGASVSALWKRPEHADLMCEVVHALWQSLTTHAHLGRQENVVDDGDADEEEEDHEDSEVEDVDSDNENETVDDDEEDENHGDSESKKRKRKSSNSKASKKLKVASPKPNKASKATKSSGHRESASDDDEEDEKMDTSGVGPQLKSASGLKGRQGLNQGRLTPSVPKSTVVELGLIVKNLLAHLDSCCVASLSKLLDVLVWLLASDGHQPHHSTGKNTAAAAASLHTAVPPLSDSPSSTTLKARAERQDREGEEERKLSNTQVASSGLVSLTSVDVCRLLLRLSTAAQLQAGITAAEVGLSNCVGDNGMGSSVSWDGKGVSGVGSTKVENLSKGMGVGAVDKVDLGKVEALEDEENVKLKGKEEGEEDENDVGGEDVVEGKVEGSSEVEEKEEAKKLLGRLGEIARLSGCLEFV